MNIYQKLLQQLAERPDAVAVIDTHLHGTRRTTYSQLVYLIERAAANLQCAGIHNGDTVLLIQGLSLELYVSLLALMKLGATAMVIDPSLSSEVLKQCCEIGRPRAIIGGARGLLFSLINDDLRSIPRRISIGRIMQPSRARAANTFDAWPDMPALITFTSGSTAVPKAIGRSHGFLLDQHEALQHALDLRKGSAQLVTLPVFVLANLASGVTSVLPNTNISRPARINARAIIDHLRITGASEILASPAFVERLCEYAFAHDRVFNFVERIFTGGGPVTPSSYRKLRRVFPCATIYGVYGSTEAEPIAKIDLADISEADFAAMANGAGLLAGSAEASVDLAILDLEWRAGESSISSAELDRHRLSAGEIGEIIVAGKHVVKSYINQKCNLESKILVRNDSGSTNVFHRTGDAGYLDNQGRLWLLGRVSARIKDEFGVLYPLACETQVLEQTNVKRAAVVHRKFQRAMVVESDEPGASDALERIARRSNIDRIIFVTSIPLDARHNSKVDYRALHKILDEAG